MSTWAELMDLARDQLSDRDKASWSDQTLLRYFGFAQEKACRWGYLLRASKSVTLEADTTEYSFPSRSIYILRMMWGGSTKPMDPKTSDYMDRRSSGWDQGAQTGSPRVWVQDQDTKKFKVWRTPDADTISESAALTLTCVMLPAAAPTESDLAGGSAEPEIEAENHEDLVDYVMYRAHLEDSHSDGRKKAHEDLARFKAAMNAAKAERIQQNWGNTTQWAKVW